MENFFNKIKLKEDLNSPKIKSIKLPELKCDKTYNDKKFYTTKRDFIRIVCISDTHSKTDELKNKLPDGDILIHSGDFSLKSKKEEIQNFKSFLNSLPHTYKIIIAGNHEIIFDKEKFDYFSKKYNHNITLEEVDKIKTFREDIFYLEDSSINLFGYNFYGSPYTTYFHDMAFMKKDELLKEHWEKIPDDVDVLITHGPPKYIGDLTKQNTNAGSETLYEEIKNRIKPKFHIFGHIHEGKGCYIDESLSDSIFINCAVLNYKYKMVNEPYVFDLPLILLN